MKTAAPTAVAMHWFRKGLRLHDNPSLLKALDIGSSVYPVYILDGDCYQLKHCSVMRANFLLECLVDLDDQLQAAGSRLYVAKGDPTTVLPELWGQFSVTDLCFEEDETGEPYGTERDRAVRELATSRGIQVHTFASETLHALAEYAEKSRGKNGESAVPFSMSSFQKLFRRMGPPCQPLDAPTQFPMNNDSPQVESRYRIPSKATGIPWPRNVPREAVTPLWGPDDCSKAQAPIVRGGETKALEQLCTATQDAVRIATFEKPKTSYTATDTPSTLCISPYMSVGCLSPRTVWWKLEEVIAQVPSTPRSKPPVSLHGQLLWRDFNNLMAHTCNEERTGSWGNAHSMPVRFCRKIPWEHDDRLLQAWRSARTGYPWIDACLTQLHATGWIHHLGRHAVACFLTRGDLWQSWEQGALHFESHLLDADYALNVFNWLWLSCSGFFYQYFRCYSPVAFAKKQDPTGTYIRKWLPALRKLPAKYIYEPWDAPSDVLRAAGIRIGVDYPEPVVEHKEASKRNMERLAAAYDQHKKSTATAVEDRDAATTQTSSKRKGTTNEKTAWKKLNTKRN